MSTGIQINELKYSHVPESSPPYYNCSALASDLGRQWYRYLRKRVGLPASSDVAAFADVLGELKIKMGDLLEPEGPLELAFVTVPNLPAMYLQDLVDAAEYSNFQLLTLPSYIHRSGDQGQWPVTELNTAYAGNGLVGPSGLIIDANSCLDKNGKTCSCDNGNTTLQNVAWSENVFSVLFTKKALTAHVLPISSATHYYNAVGVADFSLGLSSQQDYLPETIPINSTDLPYWYHVRMALATALDSYLFRGHDLDRVVVYGESAREETFDTILREIVRAAQPDDNPKNRPAYSRYQPVFTAARGAAMFGRLCHNLPGPGTCFPDLRPQEQGW
jgi:hypothetical protein